MFRVAIRGRFKGLTDFQRAELLADTDIASIGFTETGTFTCDRSASSFGFRVQVDAEDGDGEEEATLRALDALDAHGYPYEILRVSVTDLRTVKVRPGLYR
ncbi:hypothetical protein N865_13670 [Intrasporangium oryzae NRRL B-24470]|uniref:Uncharacterized protein n=1 Tax=Intrasporangium oryzae NRRL B-24470 TaxID=1386089 RepID=W9GA84_9MICO|nr:DUF6204 family protein [Intrasporangium oryzae]EWT00784.1 hypothetical protein N865_13670 [Intrasporangium oryzae NRRL B-24470]